MAFCTEELNFKQKPDLDLIAGNNLMTKKRKLYLCKRSLEGIGSSTGSDEVGQHQAISTFASQHRQQQQPLPTSSSATTLLDTAAEELSSRAALDLCCTAARSRFICTSHIRSKQQQQRRDIAKCKLIEANEEIICEFPKELRICTNCQINNSNNIFKSDNNNNKNNHFKNTTTNNCSRKHSCRKNLRNLMNPKREKSINDNSYYLISQHNPETDEKTVIDLPFLSQPPSLSSSSLLSPSSSLTITCSTTTTTTATTASTRTETATATTTTAPFSNELSSSSPSSSDLHSINIKDERFSSSTTKENVRKQMSKNQLLSTRFYLYLNGIFLHLFFIFYCFLPRKSQQQQQQQQQQSTIQKSSNKLKIKRQTISSFQLQLQQQQQQKPRLRPRSSQYVLQHLFSISPFKIKLFSSHRLPMILICFTFISLATLPSSTHGLKNELDKSLNSRLYNAGPPSTTTAATTPGNSIIAASANEEVTLVQPEHACKSMDIRNTPNQFAQLENCTVIEGFLLITLINSREHVPYNKTFPLLTEVTEYIVIYQAYHLKSLAQIFPNLSIIRGYILFEGYALIVYENPHLEELGLSKLISIPRGGVRIEKNTNLCFVETIDWSQIVPNATEVVYTGNRNNIECPLCPGDRLLGDDSPPSHDEFVCKERHGHRYCWNSTTCQKICPEKCKHNCVDENTCCSESCIGGCSAHNLNECINCKRFTINNSTCIDSCPGNYYNYLDRRCLTKNLCHSIRTRFENNKQEAVVPFLGMCSTQCPEGHSKNNETCVVCGEKCIKTCQGVSIESIAFAKELHGCHIIEGSLTISIKRGGRHLMEDLAYGLSSIEVITETLKIQGTYGIFNLRFFKNLKSIGGKKPIDDKYSFYVLENSDLETIWNPNQTVAIENGTVYFHFNPKLCLSEIQALLPMVKNQTKFDKNEVSEDSNGSKGSCNITMLYLTMPLRLATTVSIRIENPMVYEDDRTFIGYQYFYIEDKYRNATKYGYRPCDDRWQLGEMTKQTSSIFMNLKPFTNYSYYVKTLTISTERRNAKSKIYTFKTMASQPNPVENLKAEGNASSSIYVSWSPPNIANGNLYSYKIRAILDRRNPNSESTNYCKEPFKERFDSLPAPIAETTEKPTVITQDCNCPKNWDEYNEDVDANIHAAIDLENTLQNFVYVRKTGNETSNTANRTSYIDSNELSKIIAKNRNRRAANGDPFESFLLRHVRDLSDNTIYSGGGGGRGRIGLDINVTSTTTTPELSNNITPSFNVTRMDPSGDFYEVYIETVNKSINEITLTKLKHFSIYQIGVIACRESERNNPNKNCSSEKLVYAKTKKLDNVDMVENFRAVLETTNTSRTNIRLFWNRPSKPNGAVVTYTILYVLQAPDSADEKKCVTEVDYIELGYYLHGYLLTQLQTGNYSLKIRANTLAGDGQWSNEIFLNIPATTPPAGLIAGLAVAVVILFVIVGLVVYWIFRKRLLIPPSDLKISPTVNPYYISLQYIADEWEVARERVLQLNSLGQGSFGMVYEGILKGNTDGIDVPCAIKTVNENATDRERMNFLKEASVMKQFDTYHVVRLLGVCSRGQPALVVMELMKNGDLKSYLRAHRPDERYEMGIDSDVPMQAPPLSRIYQMAIEIADGMAYLAAMKFVHRDLAARNCMVALDLTVKIGDFGMTRDIYETDYYRKGTKGLLPVRWMPAESLRDGVYSTASDVFSYGVVLWEMATLASQPYQGLSNDQVLRYVIDGGVMERPENCPDKLYSLMQKCWAHRVTARPTFMKIISYLMEFADPSFKDVSYFHSVDGQKVLNKEIDERPHLSGDVLEDIENDKEDVTTPLRLGEYSGCKLNMDNNLSVEHHGGSTMILDDEATHSPYSIGSPMVVSSTPDESIRNSFNMSQNLHPKSQHSHRLNSAPSTSTGIRRLGSIDSTASSSHHMSHPHTHPHTQSLYQPSRFSQKLFNIRPQPKKQAKKSDDVDAYVQPDFFPGEYSASGKPETDERGYEIYDPSPNYSEQAPCNMGDDDEDDFGANSTAGQNLLGRTKDQRQPTIMPLSSSVPDDVICQQAASSLHPSTASAASSNASSKTATGSGKYSSLRAVADSVGTSLMPSRLRMMNMRIFNHKRSGSNVSHKSTSSNPNAITSGGSNHNLTRGGRGKSMSGQNLGTIESGSSFSAVPRFFTANTGTGVAGSEENRKRSMSDVTTGSRARGKFLYNSNPHYRVLDESLNTTGSSSINTINTASENYQIMQPAVSEISDIANYVVMNEPQKQKKLNQSSQNLPQPKDKPAVEPLEDVSNYQIMAPVLPSGKLPVSSSIGHTSGSAIDRFNKLSCSSSAASSSASSEDESVDDLEGTEGIKMDQIPLSRRSSNDKKKRTTIAETPAKTTASSTISLKEKWLNQQEQSAAATPPPPNGFVGRDGDA